MKYLITVRPLGETDVSFDCPYGNLCSDDDDYNVHLNSLASDIESLDDVNSVRVSNNAIIVDSALPKPELLEKMKPFFSRELCFVRYLNIENCA